MENGNSFDYRLEDLIDIPLFQTLQDKLNEVHSFPSAIIDNDGKILTATAWQDICTKFHRVHMQSEMECILSDQYIKAHIHEANPAVSYRCPHGMVDNATPIMVEGKHLGNFFTGQLFLEEPDYDFFKKQAQKYGFHEKAYLEAVARVPVWSKEKLSRYLDFIKSFVEILASIGLKNLREIETRELVTESERKYRFLAENIKDVIWTFDTQTLYFNYVSPSVQKLRGYTPEEIMAQPVDASMTPEAAGYLKSLIRERAADLRSGKLSPDTYFTDQVEQPCKDGSTVWTEVVTSYFEDPDTHQMVAKGVTREITDRRRLESEQESLLQIMQGLTSTKDLQEYLRLIHQVIKGVIYAENFFVTLKNKKTGLFEEVYSADQYDGPMPPSKLEKSLCAYVFRTGEPLLITREKFEELVAQGEVELVGTDSPSWLGVPLIGPTETIGVMVVQDYHTDGRYSEREKVFLASIASQVALAVERKQSEEARRQSEEKFTRAFQISPDSININRLKDGLYLEVNAGFTSLTGYTAEDILGKTSLDLEIWKNPEDRGRLVKGLRESGEVSNLEAQFCLKNGGFKTCLMSARIIEFNGEPCILSITRDITERKQAEEEKEKLQQQLLQAQKMESVGRLAGGVAHDFNNLLGVIMGHAETALAKASPGQADYHDLQEILKAAERSAGLTRQLLAFARKQTISPRVLDLNATISSLLDMFRRLIGENIDLVWAPSHDLWPIRLDPSQVDQILANLLVNARDAISGTGKVVIETRNAAIDEIFSARHAGLLPGEYVVLSVIDSGCGMDQDTRAHIFEPFYTTKEVGKGTGLGLATVYGIVKQNHGYIDIVSESGKGATVTIYFPRTEAEAAPTPSPAAGKTHYGGTEVLLVVEDEAALLELVKETLEERGYVVLAANTPAEALRLAEERGGEIRLLITDVVMPEMNGRVLAEQIAAFQPKARCLFMSGYTADIIADHGVLPGGIFFIQKPFLLEDLAERVREALDQR